MRRVAIVILLALSVSGATQAAESRELVTDGGFERGLIHWRTTCTYECPNPEWDLEYATYRLMIPRGHEATVGQDLLEPARSPFHISFEYDERKAATGHLSFEIGSFSGNLERLDQMTLRIVACNNACTQMTLPVSSLARHTYSFLLSEDIYWRVQIFVDGALVGVGYMDEWRLAPDAVLFRERSAEGGAVYLDDVSVRQL